MASLRRHLVAIVVASCVPVALLAAPAGAAPRAEGAPHDRHRPPAASGDHPGQRGEGRHDQRGRTMTAAVHDGGGGAAAPSGPGRGDVDRGHPSAGPSPSAQPPRLDVPGTHPVRPHGPGDGVQGPVLAVPPPRTDPGTPVEDPAPAPPPPAPNPQAPPPAPPETGPAPPATPTHAAPASAATPSGDPPSSPAPDRPVAIAPPGWPVQLDGRLRSLLDDVGASLDRVVPRQIGPIREPLIEVVPVLLAILGAFLALQRGIGHGLGHVPMVVLPARRHTARRD